MDTETLNNMIVGMTIEQVRAGGYEFGTSYPVVENGIVTGSVDGNYPLEYNNGKWQVVDGDYAIALIELDTLDEVQ